MKKPINYVYNGSCAYLGLRPECSVVGVWNLPLGIGVEGSYYIPIEEEEVIGVLAHLVERLQAHR